MRTTPSTASFFARSSKSTGITPPLTYALMMRLAMFLMPPSLAALLEAGALNVNNNHGHAIHDYSLGVSGTSSGLHEGEKTAQVENQREPATHGGRM